jgi:predicted Zn-dependent protease
MAKPGRNDPCPCGSGNKYKKYKKCCLAKDEAASLAQLGSEKTREELTEDAARRAVPHLPGIHELKTAIAARLGMSEDNLQRYDELMDASDAVVDLVRSAKLDAAEVAARDLLARFPDQPDGWDRLGMVYEARGENQKAAEAYRKVIASGSTQTPTHQASRTRSSRLLIGSTRHSPDRDRRSSARATPGRRPPHPCYR